MFDQRERAYVETARVARLATADADGRPNVVPVCFALLGDDGESGGGPADGVATDDTPDVVTPIDEKPKRGPPDTLRRSRDVEANPRVAVVVDHYTENWESLGWVQIRGTATHLSPHHDDHADACVALREKYDQYENHTIEERPVVRIRPGSVLSWGRLERAE